LADALTDPGVTFFTDLSVLLLNFDVGIERSLELAEDEDVDDAEEEEEDGILASDVMTCSLF